MFGEQVRAHRRRLAITQEELAAKTGVSVRNIRNIEAGRIDIPRPGTVRLLADAFGLRGTDRDRFCQSALDEANQPQASDEPGGASDTRLQSGRSQPAQLPAEVVGFTGRDRALKALDELLPDGESRSGPVVISAIAGTAGVGKTALTVHWAHRVTDQFPDGQLFINLRGYASGAPLRPIEALAALLRSLGVAPEQIPTEEDQAAALYRTRLADRKVLVVLDNARTVEQVRPLLPGSPGCLVLVTSRDRLTGLVARDGAHRLTLDVLTEQEAVALLTRLLGPDRVQHQTGAVAALAQACACLPLALRIAAANLADHPEQDIASYVAELTSGDRLTALQADGDQESAVRAALERSYRNIPADQQRMFRLLGLVPGPDFTPAAGAALADLPLREASKLLQRLSGAHLVEEHTPGRYTFHDLLRVYAHQLTDTAETTDQRDASVQWLLDSYLYTADAAVTLLFPEKLRLPLPPATGPTPLSSFSSRAAALTWLADEQPNLVAAAANAGDEGPRHFAWLLADRLRPYLFQSRSYVDWLRVGDAAKVAAETEADPQALTAAHLSLADRHYSMARYPDAIRLYIGATDLARQAEWLDGQIAAQGNLGMAYRSMGQLSQAAEHLSRSLSLDPNSGRLGGQAVNRGNLGLIYYQLGQLQLAEHELTQALALYRQLGATDGEGITLSNLSCAYQDLGRLGEAQEHAANALTLFRQVGDQLREANTLRLLAAIHRDAGRSRDALECAQASASLDVTVEDPAERSHQENTMGMVGGGARAVRRHRRADTGRPARRSRRLARRLSALPIHGRSRCHDG